jgi:transitional endoplasmic reticulum ATPase
MSPRTRLTFLTEDPDGLMYRATMAGTDEPGLTVGELLAGHPALSSDPLTPEMLALAVKDVRVFARALDPRVAGYVPPGVHLGGPGQARDGTPDLSLDANQRRAEQDHGARQDAQGRGSEQSEAAAADPSRHPARISDRQAVLLAHRLEIDRAASYLEADLSVLVRCEKVLVNHLAEEIAVRSGRDTTFLRIEQPPGGKPATPGPFAGLPSSRRSELVDELLAAIARAKAGQLLVVPHLDLLAGGNDTTLTSEARELTDALYETADCVLLAFFDPSLAMPEVLASRFDVRIAMDILPRLVRLPHDVGVAPVGRALITQSEAELFEEFDEVGLYKHIAGLNAIRLRHGVRFAAHQYEGPPAAATSADSTANMSEDACSAQSPAEASPATAGGSSDAQVAARPHFRDLVAELQTFKAKTSSSFEVPNVSWDAIGGYEDVKAELDSAIQIIGGSLDMPERLRRELVPAGFIFHGPPGTGKTLFAKAIATRLGATILVVSGPEITDKYVGESERKIRDLFAEARRNAPSVVVFDEFDSIAVRRTGNDDGGSRAGNAIVAQLLTELDGFRPEVPVLIIGTTNRLDLIDEALLRPSRFRPIKIGLPELEARRQIADFHARHFDVTVSPALLDAVAAATEQFSGDDIRSLFRDACAAALVGDRRPASPYRLGQLVGELRRTRLRREADRSRSAPGHASVAGMTRSRLSDSGRGSSRIAVYVPSASEPDGPLSALAEPAEPELGPPVSATPEGVQ